MQNTIYIFHFKFNSQSEKIKFYLNSWRKTEQSSIVECILANHGKLRFILTSNNKHSYLTKCEQRKSTQTLAAII